VLSGSVISVWGTNAGAAAMRSWLSGSVPLDQPTTARPVPSMASSGSMAGATGRVAHPPAPRSAM
jgi:hypothetical protein